MVSQLLALPGEVLRIPWGAAVLMLPRFVVVVGSKVRNKENGAHGADAAAAGGMPDVPGSRQCERSLTGPDIPETDLGLAYRP